MSEGAATSTRVEREREHAAPAAAPSAPALEGALSHAGNHAVQDAAQGGRAAALLLARGGAGLGNQAIQRMLGVHRHPGKDGLKDPHDASAHKDEADQREHVRLEHAARRAAEGKEQEDVDKLDSEKFFARIKPLATLKDGALAIELGKLPGKLQALVRQVQGQITDLETGFATPAKDKKEQAARDEEFRARIRTGARSWHDDTDGKVPAPKNDAASSPRATFFSNWRKADRATGKDVPTKQENKLAKRGLTGGKYPFREYTAVGWQQGHQKGRLIYDPFDDVLYLSVFHYEDETYFRIIAPRSGGGGAAPAQAYMSDWDLDLALYQAYQEVAAELEAVAARQADPEKAEPSKRDAQLKAMSENARLYMGVLYDLRAKYAAAYAEARAEVARIMAKKKTEKLRAALSAKSQTQSKSSRGKPKEESEAEEAEEEKAIEKETEVKLTVWGYDFWVNAEKGFIGFKRDKKKKATLPNYKEQTTIGDVAILFRQCVDTETIGDEEDTALMLAALLAEPSRHPVAALEALLSVIHASPIKGGQKAFGVALPMAAGGTIATGGIAVDVMLRESRIGREVIIALLGHHLGVKQDQVEAYLFDLAAEGDVALLTKTVKGLLSAALLPAERQAKGFKSLAKDFAAPAQEQAAEQPAATTGAVADAPVSQNGAPPQQVVGEDPNLFPEHLRALAVGDRPAHSRWTQLAGNYHGPRESPDGSLSPQQVLVRMRDSRDYEDINSFWVAYDTFRVDNPGATYALSPIQVINCIQRRSPTGLFVMAQEDWAEYDRFKREHPEFAYPR